MSVLYDPYPLMCARLASVRGAVQLSAPQQQALLLIGGSDSAMHMPSHIIMQFIFGCTSSLEIWLSDGVEDVADTDAEDDDEQGRAGDAEHCYREESRGKVKLDDVFMVLTHDKLSIYTPVLQRAFFERMQPYLYGVAGMGVEVLCGDYSGDEGELFKIHSFIHCVRHIKQVFIPVLHTTDTPHTTIERWPLIQAYGLDELGNHGFFTLTHSIESWNIQSLSCWHEVDQVYMEYAINNMSHLHTAINTCLHTIMQYQAHTPLHSIVAPIQQLYEYSSHCVNDRLRMMRQQGGEAAGVTDITTIQHAWRMALDNHSTDSQHSSTQLFWQCGLPHYKGTMAFFSQLSQQYSYMPYSPAFLSSCTAYINSPLIMLLEYTCPLTSFHIVRTLLLCQLDHIDWNVVIPHSWKRQKQTLVIYDDDEEEEEDHTVQANNIQQGCPGYRDSYLLHILYSVLTRLPHLFLASNTLPPTQQILDYMHQQLSHLMSAGMLSAEYVEQLTQESSHNIFQFDMYELDALGRRKKILLSADHHTDLPGTLYSFTIYLHHIPSLELQSAVCDVELGSVGYGDTVYMNNKRVDVVTTLIPRHTMLPTFFQYYHMRISNAFLSTYQHMSASTSPALSHLSPHALWGDHLYNSHQPSLPPDFAARPPNSAVAQQAQIAIHNGSNYQSNITIPYSFNSTLYYRDLTFYNSVLHSGTELMLVANSPIPILSGSYSFFANGFIFTSSVGVMCIDFQQHVLEANYYDGMDEEKGDDENDVDDYDGLYILDILTPTQAQIQSSPYTLLHALTLPNNLSILSSPSVSSKPSAIAKPAYTVGIVFRSRSELRRAFLQHIQSVWQESMERMVRVMNTVQSQCQYLRCNSWTRLSLDRSCMYMQNIHNDVCSSAPPVLQPMYSYLQHRTPAASAQPFQWQHTFKQQFALYQYSDNRPHATSPLLDWCPPPTSISSLSPVTLKLSVLYGLPSPCHHYIQHTLNSDSTFCLYADNVCQQQEYVYEHINQYVDAHVHHLTGTHPLTLLFSTLSSPMHILWVLQQCTTRLPQYRWQLNCVTSIIYAPQFYACHSNAPAINHCVLQQCIQSGFVQNLLIVTPTPPYGSDILPHIYRSLKHLDGQFYYSTKALTQLKYKDVEELLLLDRWHEEQFIELRQAVHCTLNSIPTQVLSAIQFMSISLPFALERTSLLFHLIHISLNSYLYQSDACRQHALHESINHLQHTRIDGRANELTINNYSKLFSAQRQRIVFTTSATSLPSYSILHVLLCCRFVDHRSSESLYELRVSRGIIDWRGVNKVEDSDIGKHYDHTISNTQLSHPTHLLLWGEYVDSVDVYDDLIRPAMRLSRDYEPNNSYWNKEVEEERGILQQLIDESKRN